MKRILVLYRFLFFACYTAWIVALVFWNRKVLRRDTARVMLVRRRWARRVLSGVGVRVETLGTPPDRPCLLLGNHRSYLDPILMLRNVDGFPVAKAELASWPLIGKGAQWAGILYLKREQKESRASTVRAIADVIQVQGFPVILFPEGTTSDLPGMLPLKKGSFRTAAKWGLPVAPVAICFADTRDFWVGKASFLEHAWARFQEPVIHVRLIYGPIFEGTDSDWLEAQVRDWIEQQLLEHPPQNQSITSPAQQP
ncbi:MAG: 1-acyl-sn-glycerol-3-phosphate acyltransferase [Saprospiraceae bacterium]|nr:1-acyl-sn-glycerol-3-phosphate acyltransferase [Saprospiraceae bacterium]